MGIYTTPHHPFPIHHLPPVAVVGLDKTTYLADEGVGQVEVCALVHSSSSRSADCPANFSFEITVASSDGSAGNSVSVVYNVTLPTT